MTSQAISTGLPTDKIAKMISLDIPISKIALAFGVSPEKISELVSSDSTLQVLITQETAKQVQQEVNQEVSYRNIEKSLLTKIAGLIPESESLGEVTSALAKIATVRAQKAQMGAQQAEPGATLNLTLSHIGQSKVNITISNDNQIEAINGRTMASMPYKATMDLLTNKTLYTDSDFNSDREALAEVLDIPDIASMAKERQDEAITSSSQNGSTEASKKATEE